MVMRPVAEACIIICLHFDPRRRPLGQVCVLLLRYASLTWPAARCRQNSAQGDIKIILRTQRFVIIDELNLKKVP
jgi:hypothetical protein